MARILNHRFLGLGERAIIIHSDQRRRENAADINVQRVLFNRQFALLNCLLHAAQGNQIVECAADANLGRYISAAMVSRNCSPASFQS